MNAPLLAALFLLLLPSCGGGSDPRALTEEGSTALSSGQYEVAAKTFERALAAFGTDTTSSDWLRAKMGLIQSHTRTDASKAQTEFLEFAAGNPGRVTDKHFSLIGNHLADAEHTPEAIALLEVGMAAHPESPDLKALRDVLGQKAESSGDTALLDSLKGLGYVGGK